MRSLPTPPNVPLLDGIWGSVKGSWGVPVRGFDSRGKGFQTLDAVDDFKDFLSPKGSSTQHVRFLIPKSSKVRFRILGTRNLTY